MQGILLVNKPAKWTSFDVVGHVRKLIANEQKIKPAQIKVGHVGTLDPLAEGLMVLLIGKKFTKQAEVFSKLDKDYLVTIKLGSVSVSVDLETAVTPYSDYVPTRLELEKVISSFEGKILQTPPIYSAIKIGGKRAYKLAREGRVVEMKSRPVTVYRLKLLDYKYPDVSLFAQVSSGTYIRSIVRDIGEVVKSGAVMTSLTRTKVGPFDLASAIEMKNLNYAKISKAIIDTNSLG